MSNLLALDDLFLAGAGCDIAGAFLLGKGLVLTSRQIRGLSQAGFFGFNPREVVARVEDKTTAQIGTGALILGFLLQVVGYLIDVGVTTKQGTPSWPSEMVAVANVAAAIGLVFFVYWLAFGRLRRRSVIDAAHYDRGGNRSAHPYGGLLLAFGEERWPPLPGETQASYAKRVWRVDKIIEGDG